MSRRTFALSLAGIAVVAFGLRLAYALALVRSAPLVGDALEFHLQANLLADGKGYVQVLGVADPGVLRPSADKPPLFPLLEAAVSLLGGRSWAWHHVVGALAGAGTTVVVGLLGRRIGGDRVGLAAAGIAAVYPVLVATDGSLRSESVYALTISLVLLAALRLREAPSGRRAIVAGVAIAVATLVRSEALLLLVLLVLPLAGPRRAVLAGVACLVVLAPWLVRCWIAFDRPVLVSTNVGGLLAGANCDRTYHGELLGQWDFRCLPPPIHTNEALESAHLRDVGLEYARSHAGRVPVVVAARLGRSFELFRPRQNASMLHFFEGRDLRLAQAGTVCFYVLVLLGLAGAVTLRRRDGPWLVLAAPFVLVAFTTVISYGFARLRVAAEPGLVVLAAYALAAQRTGGASLRTRARAVAARAGS
jgi:4-amino-4-deoxy-L-arabinose transferase-like glycosyltransferase